MRHSDDTWASATANSLAGSVTAWAGLSCLRLRARGFSGFVLGRVRGSVFVDKVLAIKRFHKAKRFGVARCAERTDRSDAIHHKLHRLGRMFVEQPVDDILQVITVGGVNLLDIAVVIHAAELRMLQPFLRHACRE